MKKLILATLLALPMQAFALGGYVGGGIGMADVTIKATNNNEDIYDPSFSIAGRVGFNFNDMFGLGLSVNSWVATAEDSNGNDNSVSVIPILFEFNWFAMEGHEGFYIGVNAGTITESQTVTILGVETTVSESETGYGAQAGWNIGLGSKKMHTIGFEAKYVHVDGDPQAYNFLAGMVLYNFWWGN